MRKTSKIYKSKRVKRKYCKSTKIINKNKKQKHKKHYQKGGDITISEDAKGKIYDLYLDETCVINTYPDIENIDISHIDALERAKQLAEQNNLEYFEYSKTEDDKPKYYQLEEIKEFIEAKELAEKNGLKYEYYTLVDKIFSKHIKEYNNKNNSPKNIGWGGGNSANNSKNNNKNNKNNSSKNIDWGYNSINKSSKNIDWRYNSESNSEYNGYDYNNKSAENYESNYEIRTEFIKFVQYYYSLKEIEDFIEAKKLAEKNGLKYILNVYISQEINKYEFNYNKYYTLDEIKQFIEAKELAEQNDLEYITYVNETTNNQSYFYNQKYYTSDSIKSFIRARQLAEQNDLEYITYRNYNSHYYYTIPDIQRFIDAKSYAKYEDIEYTVFKDDNEQYYPSHSMISEIIHNSKVTKISIPEMSDYIEEYKQKGKLHMPKDENHPINKEKMEQWIDAQPTTLQKDLAKFVRDKTRYVSYKEFYDNCKITFKKFLESDEIKGRDYCIYFPKEMSQVNIRNKSNFWMTLLLIDFINEHNKRSDIKYKLPLCVYIFAERFHNKHLIKQYQLRRDIYYVAIDDVSYSGGQLFNDYVCYFDMNIARVLVICPYISDYANRLRTHINKEYYDAECHASNVFYNVILDNIYNYGKITIDNEQYDLKDENDYTDFLILFNFYFPNARDNIVYSVKNVFCYFDHKIADYNSSFPTIYQSGCVTKLIEDEDEISPEDIKQGYKFELVIPVKDNDNPYDMGKNISVYIKYLPFLDNCYALPRHKNLDIFAKIHADRLCVVPFYKQEVINQPSCNDIIGKYYSKKKLIGKDNNYLHYKTRCINCRGKLRSRGKGKFQCVK